MPPLATAGVMLLAIADCSATTSFRRPQAPSYRAAIYGSGAKAGCYIARSIHPTSAYGGGEDDYADMLHTIVVILPAVSGKNTKFA